MTFGSLFSGIGGLDLGLERAGMVCKWQVEIDPYCRAVLDAHWPDVPKWDDATTFPPDADRWRFQVGQKLNGQASQDSPNWDSQGRHADGLGVDLVCGGFPCQPVSHAGKRKGIADARWLWPEFARIVGVVRPRYVLVENVPGLLTVNDGRAFSGVLGDLAALGYDADWDSLPAAAVGAPHLRYRVFIVAHAQGFSGTLRTAEEERLGRSSICCTVADADAERRNGRAWVFGSGWRRESTDCDWWAVEPDVGRVAHGVPARVDRLRALGNAVVPQVAEWIGKQIMNAEAGCV